MFESLFILSTRAFLKFFGQIEFARPVLKKVNSAFSFDTNYECDRWVGRQLDIGHLKSFLFGEIAAHL